jgi:MFS family permease
MLKENKFARFFEENEDPNDIKNQAQLQTIALPNKELTLVNEPLQLEPEQTFGIEAYRWVILGLYCLSAVIGGCLICTFTPITKTMEVVFEASTWEIYALNNLYLYSGALLNFPLLILVQRWGGQVSLTFGYAFMLAGSVCKIFLYYHKGWALAGQILCVIGYEWLHPIIGGINCFWFPPSSRVTVFGIANIAYNLGNVFGFLIPTLFVGEDFLLKEKSKTEVFYLHLTLSLLVLAGFILQLIFYREKPKKPLSEASLVVRYDFLSSLKALIKNRNFILVSVGMALLISVQFARYNNFYYMVRPFGFGQREAGFLATIESWGEIFGLLLVSYIGDYHLRPKTMLNWIPLIILISFGGTVGVYTLQDFTSSAIIAFFMGIATNTFPPLCEHYTVSVTFPVHENITIGTIFTGGLWGAWAAGAIATSIRDNYGDETFIYVIYPYFALMILCALVAFNCMEDINTREKYEAKDERKEEMKRE